MVQRICQNLFDFLMVWVMIESYCLMSDTELAKYLLCLLYVAVLHA